MADKQPETKEEVKEEPSTDFSEFLKETRELKQGIEKANEDSREILKEQQELAARNLLGGKSDAGEQPEPEKQEITPTDYAKQALQGKFNNEEESP
jgi:predicted phage gp36 major capsid-like protein